MTGIPAIRQAKADDRPALEGWLAEAGLPTDDLTDDHMEHFLVMCRGEDPIGMIGLEPSDGVGLLRSLVVDKSARSAGAGARLVAALESLARERGIAELWLLTIGADGWFARLGYQARQRADAPDFIRRTREFSGLCPGDAVLMSKPL